MTMRRTLLATSIIGAVAAGTAPAATATPDAGAPVVGPASVAAQSATTDLGPLVDLAAQRLALADEVAAAKYGTGKPIADPERERRVLGEVSELAADNGLDPGVAVRFFTDQIEAGKDVQRGLHARWDAHPESRPGERPDLGPVRRELERISDEAVRQLKATERVRAPNTPCRVGVAASVLAADLHHHFDPLHRRALDRAVVSMCA